MGLQIIIENQKVQVAAQLLKQIWEQIEVFRIDHNYTGISIPTKVLDNIGEGIIRGKLGEVHHYDLWEGTWKNKHSRPGRR